MCGVLGQINFKSNLADPEIERLKRSLLMLSHRGPDNQGEFKTDRVFLGHRRLSILDTSKRSNQPFRYKNLIAVFNGEIYNFLELREKLQKKGLKFSTKGDTEVLVKAYLEWGDSFTEKLDGCWAFCIYDTKRNRLFLSRDRIGEKPLIYYFDNEKFAFSSELPPLLNLLKGNEKEIDYLRLAQFNLYNFRHMPYNLTPFKKIDKLRPGYNLIIENGEIKHKKYLKLKKMQIGNPVEDFKKIFKKCVERTCISDVPVGIFFSGGVDSSLIAANLPKKGIKAYCFGKDEDDAEIIRARKAAKILDLELKEICLKGTEFQKRPIDFIKETIKRHGEPINLFQIIYSNIILDEMKKDGIKVAIGGNGADELFYGYNGANRLALASLIKSGSDKLGLSPLFGFFGKTKPLSLPALESKTKFYEEEIFRKDVIKEDYRNFLLNDEFKEIAGEIHSKSILDIFNWLGLRIESEHSVTMVADISGMGKGIEIRTPFLNKDILNFAQSLENRHKVRSLFSGRENKWVLRKALEEYLPKEIVYAKKMGFGYNIGFSQIVNENPKAFRHYIYEVAPKIELYNAENVQNIYEGYLNGNNNEWSLLLEILIVTIWYEEIIMKL